MNCLNLKDCLGLNKPDRLYHVSAGDINPETGKAYAINPSSGVWDDNYFAQNFGGASGGSGGSFNFDYAQEAEKAYGELGLYYDRILKESEGDTNKALARLNEDYSTGVRYKVEDLALQKAEDARQAGENRKGLIASALSRGLYTKSAQDIAGPQDPTGEKGYGIPDVALSDLQARERDRSADLDRGLARYLETAGIEKSRAGVDLPEKLSRQKFELEQQRRTQAGELSNLRGDRAYQKYAASAALA